MAAGERSFKGFTIDLTKTTLELPAGVTQGSYTQNGAAFHDADHGWQWFVAKFAVDGPVKITLGGCQYANAGQGIVTDEAGNELGTIDTKSAGCYHNGGVASFEYTGEATNLVVYCGEYCPMMKVEPIEGSASTPEATGFQNFSIDLTKTEPTIPTGVTKASYPQNGAAFHDAQHGWNWFAAKFDVDGPVKITIGGCQYINDGYEGYVTDGNGTKLGDLKNKTAGCYDADPSNAATFEYKGGANTLVVYCGQYCPMLKVEKMEANVAVKSLYKTNFKDWEAIGSSESETSVKKTTTDGQELTFYLKETQANPTGTNGKFTSECISEGYLMAAKTATPYIKTSTLASVTTVKFVHAATGSSRGWGLKAKGDGDADWVVISDAIANPSSGQEVEVEVNRTNVQLWFYNLNASQNAYMTSLEIKGKVEVEPRNFENFTVDFRSENNYTVVAPTTGLPKGVTVDAGTFHDAQHGYSGVKMTVPVDGPVKFTIGGCQYSNQATVSIDGGTPIVIETQGAGCDNRFGEYNKSVVYTYNEEKAATLTFDLGNYCPFIIAEACDFIPSVTVTYYNTDGKVISEETVAGNSELQFKYSVADLTIPEGQAFRGWFDGKASTAKKVKEGVALTEDIKLYAKASEIEKAAVGTHYDYDMTKAYWYVEDHEVISIENGKYYNNHGWNMGANGTIKLQVAGKCYVNVKNCQYSNEQTVSVTDSEGKEVTTFALPASADGAATAFQYDGPATTLTFTFPVGSAYIHGIEVYNVENFLAYDEATGYYQIPSGDASSLMLAIKSAKDGDKIFLPNGTYDFGETVLTQISANNLSIIGESMDKTIIRNAPDKSIEGIGTTATLLNTSKNLYMQDLTIQNALDYYACGGTGRAVCLQDKGENTICKNVKMLSYQDTYYSNKASKFYWEDCEIHGTVDYLCGDGDVIYNRCKFVNESRENGKQSGSDVLCAPYTTSKDCPWGYVFLDCSVASQCTDFTFARAWGGEPRAQFIRTKILDNSLAASRFTVAGMNVAADKFKEYATTNPAGNVSTPESNVIEFTHSSGNKKYETVLTDEEAAQYTVANIFGEWAPDKITAQETDKDNGTIFLVNGKITTVRPTEGKYRIANARGGFGPVIDLTEIYQIDGKDVTAQYIKNADFSDGLNDWTANNFAKPDKQELSNYATEAYAGWAELEKTEYSLMQKIKLPAGNYKLVSNSFFRQGETYNTDVNKSLAFLKVGDQKIALKTLASETPKDYANSQATGAGVTTSGMYLNEIPFEVTGNGEIEIGIVGTFDVMRSWCIVGGFKLYDMGKKADLIDMTNKIANNSFENGLENWTVEGDWAEQNANNEKVKVGTRYAEKWQNAGALPAGKIYQTIKGLENGKYIVKASAIAKGEGTQLFANDLTAVAPEEAAILSIEVEVTDHKLTIGFERTSENQAYWVAVDNFQLYYVQNDPSTAIETITAATTKDAPKKFFKDGKIVIVKNGKAYNVAGVELK